MRLGVQSAVPISYTEVGYGNAISNVYHSLIRLGHQPVLEDYNSPIQFHWMQPKLLKTTSSKYNVLYFPWESTEFRTGWLDVINSDLVDEVWTVSNWSAKIFKDLGVRKPVRVFPHGISSDWSPKLRTRGKNRPLKYLIVDAEANRKGWQEAFDAFREVFKDDPQKATLTIKSRQRCMARWFDNNNMVRSPGDLPNVTIDVSKKSPEEMVKLYQDHDVFLAPSYGEGWGFLPFQMLATGSIAITTKEWCHYSDYLGDFGIDSDYIETKWQGEHPGKVCQPNQQHLVELVQKSYDEFEDQAPKFFKNAFKLHAEYDWMKLTEKAFEGLEERASKKIDPRRK